MNIALIGDFNEEVTAHRAIPLALQLASPSELKYQWINTNDIVVAALSNFTAFWCVPASPYANMEKVLELIKYARTNDIPFLGTCGGYQHSALEFARNALGFLEADNVEVNAETKMPLIAGLSCKLYDEEKSINLKAGSLVADIYATNKIDEEYYCGFGVNRAYLSLFESSDLSFTGFDDEGDPRALEIRRNKFFIGTAFQPERSAFSGKAHPLIKRFVQSAQVH